MKANSGCAVLGNKAPYILTDFEFLRRKVLIQRRILHDLLLIFDHTCQILKPRPNAQALLDKRFEFCLSSMHVRLATNILQIIYSYITLKYVSIIHTLNFEIVAVTRPCISFSHSYALAFQSSDRAELDF